MTPNEIALFVGGMLCGASLTCTIAGFIYWFTHPVKK